MLLCLTPLGRKDLLQIVLLFCSRIFFPLRSQGSSLLREVGYYCTYSCSGREDVSKVLSRWKPLRQSLLLHSSDLDWEGVFYRLCVFLLCTGSWSNMGTGSTRIFMTDALQVTSPQIALSLIKTSHLSLSMAYFHPQLNFIFPGRVSNSSEWPWTCCVDKDDFGLWILPTTWVLCHKHMPSCCVVWVVGDWTQGVMNFRKALYLLSYTLRLSLFP